MLSERINIFTGHFGSGKTEVSINYAMNLLRAGYKTAIVDLDIVNPYFRTADVKDKLKEMGIHVIVPPYANTNVDIPALPAEINTLFENKSFSVVFDVGGDNIGATALGRYKQDIIENGYDMFIVVNTNRPFTDTQEKIKRAVYEIEEASRLKATKLVNNTNLMEDTTIQDILRSQEILMEVAQSLTIPLSFTAFLPKRKDEVKIIEQNIENVLLLEKMIKLPWER